MNPFEVIGTLKGRIMCLQGLALRLNVSIHSREGKVLVQMIDILDDLAEAVTNIQDGQPELIICKCWSCQGRMENKPLFTARKNHCIRRYISCKG